jgi:hypothetical protein
VPDLSSIVQADSIDDDVSMPRRRGMETAEAHGFDGEDDDTSVNLHKGDTAGTAY